VTDRLERLKAHAVMLPEGYVPDPQRHLCNARDSNHYLRALSFLKSIGAKTVLDIGCYDGWLDFLLVDKGYSVEGVELIPELAAAARRYADRNFLTYRVHEGSFADLSLQGSYDAVICFETLEHMPLEEVLACVPKMASLATKGVLISLPDQDHNMNLQHLWTASEDLMREIWGAFKNFKLDYLSYPGTSIPGNFFISHQV
jgi:2-polyprenyl-3-methyl-5-hydroxy-6-metoxy-1,4-benzoquinol methylase